VAGWRPVMWVFAAAGLVLLFGPVGILLWKAGSLPQAWSDPAGRRAIFVTMGSGAIALTVVVMVGVPLSWWLARAVAPSWQKVWGTLLVVPLLMPPLVLGLVLAYAAQPALNWDLALTNSWAGLILAQVTEALPYFVLSAWGYLRTIPRQLEEDVWVLGKSPAETARYIVWPLARPGLVVAAAMAWARIVGAFGAPVVVAYHPSALPVAIWITLEEEGLPAALALALWLMVVSVPVPLWLNARYAQTQRARERI
jgi:molybdate/tungstate transport system permease protein